MAEKYNNPSYNAKINILKKIDDAASVMGSTKSRQGAFRDIGAKSTAKNVLNNNMHKSTNERERPFLKSDLDKLNQQAMD
jgi:hypothetical protein